MEINDFFLSQGDAPAVELEKKIVQNSNFSYQATICLIDLSSLERIFLSVCV